MQKIKEFNDYVVAERDKEESFSAQCEVQVKQTIREQQEHLQRAMSEFGQTLNQQLEEIKQIAANAAMDAERTTAYAQNTTTSAKESRDQMSQQLKMQKSQVNDTSKALDDLKRKLERCSDEMRKTEQNIASAMKKVADECGKVRDALTKLEDLQKRKYTSNQASDLTI